MTAPTDLVTAYVEHLRARVRLTQSKAKRRSGDEDLAVLPSSLASLCTTKPRECLEIIIAALREVDTPELVRAIGDGLLEDLINEKSDVLADAVEDQLRTNQRFRQAFSCGHHASVDPAITAGWVKVLRDLGTTKTAERKRLWRSVTPAPDSSE